MKLFDLVRMAVHNLWQRRFRTLLNLIGAVIGCIVLLMTAAGAAGVRDAFQTLFDTSELARQIEVYPSYSSPDEPPPDAVSVEGQMSEERSQRIRESITMDWKRKNSRVRNNQIDAERLAALTPMDHVVAVVPHTYFHCRVALADEAQPVETSAVPQPESDRQTAGVTGAGPPSESMRRSIVAGSALEGDDVSGLLIHEYLAYKLGFRSDEELQQLIGRDIRLERTVEAKPPMLLSLIAEAARWSPELAGQHEEFTVALRQLIRNLDRTDLSDQHKQLLRSAMSSLEQEPEPRTATEKQTFVIRGIYRSGSGESLTSLFYQQLLGQNTDTQIHRDVAAQWHLHDSHDGTFRSAVLIVDSSRHLRAVSGALEEAGLRSISSLRIIDNINDRIDQGKWIVFGIAAAILLTAAIGISNTLIISVTERTPEFGIMKSLGARDRHVVMLMMFEGAVLGMIGAVLAAVLSWSLSLVARMLVRMYLEYETGGEITGPLFHFSPLQILVMTVISISVCVGASIVPAIRAARLDPVVAMRRT